jgi:hypothetical protein
VATPHQHVKKAKENEAFAATLDLSTQAGVDWSMSVAFYTALHYVQAFLLTHTPFAPVLHTERDNAINSTQLKAIYNEYRELKTFSRDARYDVPGFNKKDVEYIGTCLKTVRDYITPKL